MFRSLQKKRTPHFVAPDAGEFSLRRLLREADAPISIQAVNNLPEGAQRRLYQILLPPDLLARFDVRPVSLQGAGGEGCVDFFAQEKPGLIRITACHEPAAPDPFLTLELADNSLNGIDLNLLWLTDPAAPRFDTDVNESGHATQFGTLSRNLPAEQAAMQAGLAPGQVRAGLHASQIVFHALDTFLTMLAHRAVFLEPLTYASAWLFERRGFAYVRGHKLMDDIHTEFQPGGRLYRALDGSPFRQPAQAATVRGRAWAIHDGILEAIGERWDGLRMVRQVGQRAAASTFPDAPY